jgi:hypothetical protein
MCEVAVPEGFSSMLYLLFPFFLPLLVKEWYGVVILEKFVSDLSILALHKFGRKIVVTFAVWFDSIF